MALAARVLSPNSRVPLVHGLCTPGVHAVTPKDVVNRAP